MKISDLQIGDILVDHAHAGIYVGTIDGKPVIANALSGGHLGANLRGSSPNSFLKACNSSSPSVYRCSNAELAQKAADIAKIHSQNRDISYDFKRLRVAQDFSVARDQQFVPQSRIYETFKTSGIFRAIKFAARRDVHLVQAPNKPKSKHGLRCAYALILFFQIAALQDWVKSVAPTDEKNWVSSRHIECVEDDLLEAKIGKEALARYRAFIQYPILDVQESEIVAIAPKALLTAEERQKEFPNSALARMRIAQKPPASYPSAILNWTGPSFDKIDDSMWEEKMTKAMMVDAKYIAANDLLPLFEEDKKGWSNLGLLNYTFEEDKKDPVDPILDDTQKSLKIIAS